MVLFGPAHITLLVIIATLAFVLALACRGGILPPDAVRLTLGIAAGGERTGLVVVSLFA